MALSQDKRFGIAGLNYKDKPENARRFLGSLGNPYAAIGVDGAGRAAIDWGVYGVPETFLVGRDGKILFKHVGPLTEAGRHRHAAARNRKGAGCGIAANAFQFLIQVTRYTDIRRAAQP